MGGTPDLSKIWGIGSFGIWVFTPGGKRKGGGRVGVHFLWRFGVCVVVMKTIDQLRDLSLQADATFCEAQEASKAAWTDSSMSEDEKARLYRATTDTFTASCEAWKALQEGYAAEREAAL